ncbi:MAG: hypothetical protein ACI4QO_02535 [Clostridia bacterium]
MHRFSIKRTYFYAYLLTAAVTFTTAIIFSVVFTLLPLGVHILTIFSNLCLGLAVFSGAFYIARSTPFFCFRHILVLSAAVLLTVLLCTVSFGELSSELMIQKTVLICAASLLGEICGRV